MNRSLPFLFSLLFVITSHTAELNGKITAVEAGRLKIQLEGGAVPSVGDPVKITAIIAGRKVSGGTAEVVEVADGLVWAGKVQSTGKPNVGMVVVITSASPRPVPVPARPPAAPRDPALARELFDQGLILFKKVRLHGAHMDPFRFQTRGDSKAPEYLQAYALFEKAAEAGSADAVYFLAKYKANGPAGINDIREAFRLLENAAEAGQKDALYEMAANTLYASKPSDYERALAFARKAKAAGHPGANALIGRIQKEVDGTNGSP